MMARLCERPGCSVPASVAYGFEAARTMVWLAALDPDDLDRARLGSLCRRHADSLTPPRGWWLDDRRVLVPQLFAVPEPGTGERSGASSTTSGRVGSAPVDHAAPAEGRAAPTEPPSSRSTRRRKRNPEDPTGELPLAFTEPEPELFEPTAEDHPAHDVGGPDRPVDERSSVAGHESAGEASGPASGSAAAVDPAGGTPDHDETVALPWTPAFDHGDDLGGVLSARSPLLSRAFGLAPRHD
jgi:hypothetical protein